MVKAGPKKARTKVEEAIRAAVEENTPRGRPKASRKSSKVRSYTFKETDAAKRLRADRYLAEMQRVFGLREPRHESEFLEFYDTLKEDERMFAVKLFQMSCWHDRNERVASSIAWSSGEGYVYIACTRCGLVRRDDTSVKRMRLAEWNSYCPEGFDAFDWTDLLMTDKSIWRFIHDEALAEMVDASMTKED